MRKRIKFFALILYLFLAAGMADAQKNTTPKVPPKNEPPKTSINTLVSQSEKTEQQWDEAKKSFKNKIESFINKLDEEIRARRETLDHGDLELRKRLNVEVDDLNREKENNKKLLAELRAITAVDLVKMKESVARKIDREVAKMKGR